MALDVQKWWFLTKVLGCEVDPALAPKATDTAPDVTAKARKFDPAGASKEDIAEVSGFVTAWADAIHDAGRHPPKSDPPDPEAVRLWQEHCKSVRGTIPDTRAMRAKIKSELVKPDLAPDIRAELEALQDAVNNALVEALDLEEAHGPTNHLKITPAGAGRRAMLGEDPRKRDTGKPDSAMRATRFTSKDAFLDAFDTALSSKKYQDKYDEQMDLSDPDNPKLKPDATGYFEIELPLQDVFGDDYLDAVSGFTFNGAGGDRKKLIEAAASNAELVGVSDKVGVVPTNLKGGQLRVGFKFEDGVWELNSMFPIVAEGVDRKVDAEGAPRDAELTYDTSAGQWQKKNPDKDDAWCPYDPDTQTWITPEPAKAPVAEPAADPAPQPKKESEK